MKVIFSLLAIILLFPAQASALDLKPLVKEIFRATDSVQFSDFRMLDRGNGQYDWYVTMTNTGNQNLARNQYELQTYQVDRQGRRYEASGNNIMDVDIRPGRSLNLQQPFTPVQDIAKVGFAFVSKRNNTALGAREFDAQMSASAPVQAKPKITQPSTTTAEKASQLPLAPVDLRLGLRYLGGGKAELAVRNMGAGNVNLAHYKFKVKAHAHGQMAVVEEIKINRKLIPGNQVKVTTRNLGLGHCGTLAWYTAEAEGQNLRFTAHMVPDAHIRLQVGSIDNIRIDPLDRKGEIDEYTAIFFQAQVYNFGETPIDGYAFEGTVDMKTNKGSHWYPFRLQGGDTLAPGKNVVNLRLRGDGNHATIDLPDGPIWWQKPEWLRITLRVTSPGGCGLEVPYSSFNDGEWRKN